MNEQRTSAILDELDTLEPLLEELVAEAVRIPSVAPTYPGVREGEWSGQEARVIDLLADIYSQAGARTRTISVDPERPNVCATLGGTGPGKSLAFNGHVDVVPPGPERDWTVDPFGGTVADGRLYGRGSVDQKAGLVAQAVAALAISRTGIELAGRLDLQAVVGEETGEHDIGTRALINRLPKPDAAVISEPSPSSNGQLGIGVTSAGVTRFILRASGRRAHGTTRGPSLQASDIDPEQGINAIDSGISAYQALRDLEQEWAETKHHPLFSKGAFAIAPAVIHGQSAGHPTGSIVPDEFCLTYSVIHHPDDRLQHVRAEIESAAQRAEPSAAKHHLDWQEFAWAPLNTDNAALAGSIERIAHTLSDRASTAIAPPTPTACFGVSDATLFQQAGIPAVTLGPGSGPGHVCRAHAPDEWVDLNQIHYLARLYALLAAEWCNFP